MTQCIKEGDIINLSDLLFTKNRDYLVKNNNEQVPIHTLDDKVVGLYFYEEDYTGDVLTEKFKTLYERLAVEQKFEIVFIYLGD